MTDVLTSGGVITGIVLIKLTGWLDPRWNLAIGVAINIIWTGYQLIRRSASGLLDTAVSKDETDKINQVLEKYKEQILNFIP